jgi:hypothetical protein
MDGVVEGPELPFIKGKGTVYERQASIAPYRLLLVQG